MVLYSVCKGSVTFNDLTNLKAFSNLYQIFSSINRNSNLSEKNPILINIRANNERSIAYLNEIESALRILDLGNWPSREKNALISRLTSSRSSDSFAVLNELQAYLSLVGSVGLNNVTYQYPTHGKKPDFKVHINSKQIILELKSLHDRQSIVHIKDVFRNLCEFLLLSVNRNNYYIRIDIDTNRLPKKKIQNNRENISIIDVERSIKLFKNYLSILRLEQLIGLNCGLNFSNSNHKRLSINDFVTFFEGHESRLYTDKQYIRWSELVNLGILNSCPFHYIIIANLKGKECVEIASVDFFSQNPAYTIPGEIATSKSMAAFQDQLRRTLKDKIKSQQREISKPYIIIIKTRLDQDWQYEYEMDIEDFLIIKEVIKEEIKNDTEVSGVIIYYSDLKEGRYIENRSARAELRIQLDELQNSNILKYYHSPLIDNEIELEEGDDQTTQLAKMTECIKIEEQITDRLDKHKLLRNMEIFLRNSQINENILHTIEGIVLKYCENNEDENNNHKEILDKKNHEPIELAGIDIKFSAVVCLSLLLGHRCAGSHLKLLEELTEDENLFVKLEVASKLYLIYENDANACVRITNRYLHENWFTRHCLLPIMSYFLLKNIEILLQLQFINSIFSYYEEDKNHCSTTIIHAIQIMMYNALLHEEFRTMLFSLLNGTTEEILLLFARNCDFNDKVKNEEYQEFIIQVNTCIINSLSTRVKHLASHTFLNNLIEQNISLYPGLKSYLFLVSKISGTISEPYLSFSIIEYLAHFCYDFPIESILLLENIFEMNIIRDLTIASHDIFNLIDRLYNFDIPEVYKNKLAEIARRCYMDGEPPLTAYANSFMKEFNIEL